MENTELITKGLAALTRQYGEGRHRIEYNESDGKFYLTVDRGRYFGKRIYTRELMHELIGEVACDKCGGTESVGKLTSIDDAAQRF